MALDSVQLRKLLKLMMMKESLRSTAIRADAKAYMRKRDEGPTPGGDFHVPFWSAAKSHAAGREDLHEAVGEQVEKNLRRKNLYPRLKDGFLSWWGEERRWINEPIRELPQVVKSRFWFAEIEGVVKVDNLLCLKVGEDKSRLVYPYFSEKPQLSPEFARLGLWLMVQAISDQDPRDMRILDVLRASSFSMQEYPLRGNEEEQFTLRYRQILREWRNHLR